LDVKDLEIAISGSCDMTLRGNADDQDIAISGSGDVNAAALKGATAEVAISGSGDVKLGVYWKGKDSCFRIWHRDKRLRLYLILSS
jgi:hypothetical protein